MQNPYLPANNDEALPQVLRRRITFNDQPPVLMSFGTGFPHKIRFRKRVNFWPFRFTAQAAYIRESKSLQYGCSCQDSVLGGGVHLDIANRSIEYKKELRMQGLPLSNLIFIGRCAYMGMIAGQPQLRPSFSLHMEVGRGAATLSNNGVAVQQELPITRHVRAEVCGSVHFPMPVVTYSAETGGQQFRLGQGVYELQVDQLNPILQF